MKKLSLLLISMMSTFFLYSQTAGTLDLTFGDNGQRYVDIGGNSNYCYGADIQSDLMVVMGGQSYNSSRDISFARLDMDGDLDPGFGSGGVITYAFDGSDEEIRGVLSLPDNRTIGVGYTCSGGQCSMILVQLTQIGLLDPTFSNDGMLVIDFGPGYESFGYDLVRQDDGKIIAVGHVRDFSGNEHMGMCRVNPDGTLDQTFATNGVLIMNFLSYDNYINNIAFQGNKIIVGGHSYFEGDHFLTIARFSSDGILDMSFGVNGIFSIQMDIDPMVISATGAMCIDMEDRIIYGCYQDGITGANFAVYCITPFGSPDPSFGISGLSVTPVEENGYIQAITCQQDNKIIAGGYSSDGYALVRYLENGDPDPDFGTAGTGIVIGSDGTISDLKIQPDGLILASGYGQGTSNSDFLAARYHSDVDIFIDDHEKGATDIVISPNPVQDRAGISFTLEQASQVKARVINTNGQTVAVLADQVFPAGDHRLKWHCEDVPGGIYLIRMLIGNEVYTSKIVISQRDK